MIGARPSQKGGHMENCGGRSVRSVSAAALAAVVTLIGVAAPVANAQDRASTARTQGIRTHDERPIELNAGGGAVGSWLTSLVGGHAGMTVPINATFAIDGFVAVGFRDEVTAGLYAFGVQQRLARTSGTQSDLFLTDGLTGYFEPEHDPPYRYTGSRGQPLRIPG